FFHELPGKNFPVTSPFFWIDQRNRTIVRRLISLADAIATNTREHTRLLERLSNRTDIPVVPVGSNIEPDQTVAAPRKENEFAIFGLPFGRWQTLELFASDISEWQKNGCLTKLHLIGPVDEKYDARSARLIERLPRPETVILHGFLPTNEVS